MDFDERLDKYAELIVYKGCALKGGQELYITAPLQTVDFTRRVVRTAYEAGARQVTVAWSDEVCGRMTYDNAPLEVFETLEPWRAERSNSMVRRGAAILNILSEDPEVMTGVDQAKIIASARASHAACKEFYDALDFGRNVWCIAGASSPDWACKVFPDLSEEEATRKLWDAIMDTARVDNDPCAAWDAHRATFDARKAWLNSQHLDALHYTASNGTDFTVGLLEKGRWEGGGQATADGTYFFPNIPTEEIFTSPDRMRADGIVHSALPLIYNGARVQDFWVRFEDGKAVECDAEVGRDVLQGIIDIDEGSCRLGECALIPYESPIRQTGILFLNTLYDENASCHLALGKGFPDCYEGGYDLDSEQLEREGVNESATHVDFMIGTEDLCITGIKADGSEVSVFSDGTWAE